MTDLNEQPASAEPQAAAERQLTCGQCINAVFHSKADLTQRVCWGAPATPVQIINAAGQPQWVNMRGTVSISDRACGAFKPKPGIGHQCPTCLTWHVLDG